MAPHNILACIYHHIQCLIIRYSSFLSLSLGNTPYMLYIALCHFRLSTFYQVGIVHSELECCMEQNCHKGQRAPIPQSKKGTPDTCIALLMLSWVSSGSVLLCTEMILQINIPMSKKCHDEKYLNLKQRLQRLT